MSGCAAWQIGHHAAPNSSTAGPGSVSIALRAGSASVYRVVIACIPARGPAPGSSGVALHRHGRAALAEPRRPGLDVLALGVPGPAEEGVVAAIRRGAKNNAPENHDRLPLSERAQARIGRGPSPPPR